MRAEVVESQRLRLADDEAEDPESPGEMPNPAHEVIVDSLGDELGQQDLALRGGRTKHADGAVLRSSLIAGDLDDSLQYGGQLQVRRDREDRVENPLHLGHAPRVAASSNGCRRRFSGDILNLLNMRVHP